MNTLLNTKIEIPKTFGTLIERPRLLQQLDHSLDVPLTLVVAPAGFGKTTLVCQWIEQRKKRAAQASRVAWLSLNAHDSAFESFLAYFVAAIRKVYPGACAETAQLLADSQINSEQALLVSIVNDLDALGKTLDKTKQALLIVLDDYDSLSGQAINEMFQQVLRYPQRGLHFYLTCRRDPDLPLARWRGKNLVHELRSHDLRLTRAEIAELVNKAVPIAWSDKQISALEVTTEGWAAGLHLITLTAHEQAKADRLAAALEAPQLLVMNYLMEEVIAQLPDDLQNHLLQISILDRFNAELCERVCQELQEPGAEFLKRLQKANLFIIGLDGTGEWFRFHHLFQQFLQEQFKTRYRTLEQAALHQRAKHWFQEHEWFEEALDHAFAGGDIPGAVKLVAEHRHTLMNEEQWQRLQNWLARFSAEQQAQHPDLLLTRAWLARVMHFDLDVTAELARQAEQLLEKQTVPRARQAALQGEINILLAMDIYRSRLNRSKVILLSKQALSTLPMHLYLVRSYAYLQYAAGIQAKGDLTQANAIMQQAETEEILSGNRARSRATSGAAILRWIAGDLSAVQQYGEKTLALAEPNQLHESVAWGHYFIAKASYERNDLAVAEQNAKVALRDPNPSGHFRPLIENLYILALVYQARNLPERASEVLDDAIEWVREKRSILLTVFIQAARAELALMQGDLHTANHWAENIGTLQMTGGIFTFRSPHLTLAKVLLAQNTPASQRDADALLTQYHAHLSSTHNTRFLIEVLALQALLQEQQGNQRNALATLQQALELAEPGGFIRLFADMGAPMENLVRGLMQTTVETPYRSSIARAFAPSSAPLKMVSPDVMVEPLTEREMHVMQLLAKRWSAKEIAQELVISPLTVKSHKEHIYQKLGVNSRQDAVRVAMEIGLIDTAL